MTSLFLFLRVSVEHMLRKYFPWIFFGKPSFLVFKILPKPLLFSLLIAYVSLSISNCFHGNQCQRTTMAALPYFIFLILPFLVVVEVDRSYVLSHLIV
jgi:hypothetical protein